MKIFACRSGGVLAGEIAGLLNQQLCKARIESFKDGEIKIILEESVRNETVFVVQSFPQVNHDLIELLLAIDALKRSSAKKIVAVIPYFCYARQDKMTTREPISARVVAEMLEARGTTSVITLDLHSRQIQGFFSKIPCDHLSAGKLLAEQLKNEISSDEMANAMVISPDVGGVKRARDFAQLLSKEIAIVEKVRSEQGVKVINVIGEVNGKICIILDDMVDSGGTLIEASKLLKKNGAKKVVACFTHAVLSQGMEKLENSEIDLFLATNSIPQTAKGKLKVISIAPMLSEIINAIDKNQPVSDLFL